MFIYSLPVYAVLATFFNDGNKIWNPSYTVATTSECQNLNRERKTDFSVNLVKADKRLSERVGTLHACVHACIQSLHTTN